MNYLQLSLRDNFLMLPNPNKVGLIVFSQGERGEVPNSGICEQKKN